MSLRECHSAPSSSQRQHPCVTVGTIKWNAPVLAESIAQVTVKLRIDFVLYARQLLLPVLQSLIKTVVPSLPGSFTVVSQSIMLASLPHGSFVFHYCTWMLFFIATIALQEIVHLWTSISDPVATLLLATLVVTVTTHSSQATIHSSLHSDTKLFVTVP